MPTLAPKLPYTHPFAGGYPRVGGQPLPTDPDAIDYLERVKAADGGAAVEVGVAMAVDAFVKGCKADGIWDAIKASCILCGARTISGALVPLVGAAPTAYSFASGDYSRTTGLVGDGATKYLKIEGAHQDPPLQNSAHQALYISETGSTSPAGFMTHINELDDAGLSGDGRTQITQTSTLTFTRCRESGGETLSQTPSTGFAGIARAIAASYERRLSGTTATIVDASDGVPDGDLYVFQTGASSQFSNARLAFYSIGSSLDLAALDARVTALVTAIGAAI